VNLVLFAVWCFAVALAGGLVGLVLGNLRLPATLLVASSAAAGGGANLAISAISAATASVAHIRAGRIDWRMVAWMAPPSIVGALAGGSLAGELNEDLLLACIAAVLLFSGLDLLFRAPRPPDPADPPEPGVGPAVVTGFGVGVIGGLVGLILGALRMPALLRWVRMPVRTAVGTNVVVGFLVGVAGTLAHLPNAAPDLELIAVGGAASVPGALLGSRLTGRLSEAQLVRAIGVVLLLAAAGCVAQALR
jgi:uncharacterized membrane protein YfcA